MSNVDVSLNKNAKGQLFGFSQFSNVRDMEKLSKSLNDVYFRDYSMLANVARYDGFDKFDRRILGVGEGVKILRYEDLGKMQKEKKEDLGSISNGIGRVVSYVKLFDGGN